MLMERVGKGWAAKWGVDLEVVYVQACYSNDDARGCTAVVLKYRHRISSAVGHSTFPFHHRSCAAAVI